MAAIHTICYIQPKTFININLRRAVVVVASGIIRDGQSVLSYYAVKTLRASLSSVAVFWSR